jgi:hypothetical protein
VHHFETSAIPWKVSAAAMLLLVLAMPQQLAASSPPKGAVCSSSITSSDTTAYVLPAGTTTAELDYTVTNSVGPDKGLVCHIETYTCDYEAITYPPVAATATVTDAGGVVLFSVTQMAVTDTYPVDSHGNPIGPIPQPRVINYAANIDVHAITAVADSTVNVNVNGPVTAILNFTPPCSAHLGVGRFASSASGSCGPRFVFDLDPGLAALDANQAKLLTHKYRSDDMYPSIYQRTTLVVDPNPPPLPPGTPPPPPLPQMDITGSVAHTLPSSPNDVYFKLIDPKDVAPYALADAHPGDNVVDSAGPLLMLPDGTHRTQVGQVLHATWDATTKKTAVVLEGTDRYAGNNYQVEASFDPAFPCENTHDPNYPCAASAIVTAWKRVYLETDHMFRSGTFLAANTDPASDDVLVDDGSVFHAGQSVRFIHGSPFQHGIAPSGSLFGDTSYSEDAIILTPLPTDPLPAVYLLNHQWHVRLTHPLNHLFRQSHVAGVFMWADAVGPMSGPDAGFFDSNPSLLRDYFATMFVELADAPQTVPEFPFIDFTAVTLVDVALRTMALRWFQNADRGTTPTDVHSYPNHFHVIGASRVPFDSHCSTRFGDTIVSGGGNVSWIWVRRIEDSNLAITEAPCVGFLLSTRGRVLSLVNGLTMAHELTHQWSVNVATDPTGHCHEQSYLMNGDVCLMNAAYLASAQANQIDAGRVSLHYLNHGADSEYLTIRNQTEPIPQP